METFIKGGLWVLYSTCLVLGILYAYCNDYNHSCFFLLLAVINRLTLLDINTLKENK